MGIYDRDYYRESTRRWWGHWGDRPVTLWLIGVMVGVFILQIVTRGQAGVAGRGELTDWGDYYLPAILDGQVWRLFTWQFLHEPFGFWHIAFTLLCLYFIGTELEALYGPAEFLAFYLTVSLIVSLSTFALGLAGLMPADPGYRQTGASAPVAAGFILFACHYPYRRIMVMFVLPVPAWLLATGVVLIGLMGVLAAGPIGLGFSAPLIGYAFAFAYYRFNWRILSWVPSLGRARQTRRKSSSLRVYQEPREARQPVAASLPKSSAEGPGRNVDEQLEAKLDLVLEKVARSGRESLTADEQQLLMRASEIYKRRRGS